MDAHQPLLKGSKMSNPGNFSGLNAMAQIVHANAVDKGWWDEGERNFGEIIALCHSELSEALEEHRKGVNPLVTYLAGPDGKPEGIPVELADTIIRIMDFCAFKGIDLEAAMTRKHLYNLNRPYRHGGKKA